MKEEDWEKKQKEEAKYWTDKIKEFKEMDALTLAHSIWLMSDILRNKVRDKEY